MHGRTGVTYRQCVRIRNSPQILSHWVRPHCSIDGWCTVETYNVTKNVQWILQQDILLTPCHVATYATPTSVAYITILTFPQESWADFRAHIVDSDGAAVQQTPQIWQKALGKRKILQAFFSIRDGGRTQTFTIEFFDPQKRFDGYRSAPSRLCYVHI